MNESYFQHQMALRIITSLFQKNKQFRIALYFIIDTWFHVCRGDRDGRIDYAKFALYYKKVFAENIGVRKYKTDDEKMNHTKGSVDENIPDSYPTRFTFHNTGYHMILDMDKYENLHMAQCKTLEKTNIDTKDSLKKGRVGTNYASRCMKARVDQLKLDYLMEGNGVTEDGTMDPYNGKNTLPQDVMDEVNPDNATWLSVFYDQQRNPLKPQYIEGYVMIKRIKDKKNELQSIINGKSFAAELLSVVENDLGITMDSDFSRITWYNNAYYYRRMKKYIIGINSVVVQKWQETDHAQLGKVCFVIGIAKILTVNQDAIDVIVGHDVECEMKYGDDERCVKGKITDNICCWRIDTVYRNAFYYHVCDKRNACSSKGLEMVHNWKNRMIYLYWYLGIGAHKIGDPLWDFHKVKIRKSANI